jgi:hypothetical protein
MIPRNPFRAAAALAAAALIVLAAASARADERYTPVEDPLVKKECGACHMAFQPAMLPKRSWNKLMDGLADHFGEDASLSPDKTEAIRAYLVKHAADTGWWSGRFMRGIADDATPLRITETRHWIHEHSEEVRPSAWKNPKVGSKANCPACHRRAALGDYEDEYEDD